MVTKRGKRLIGIGLMVVSAISALPPVLLVLAPVIARLWNGDYTVGLSTDMLQQIILLALFGGAGLVGGAWLITSARG